MHGRELKQIRWLAWPEQAAPLVRGGRLRWQAAAAALRKAGIAAAVLQGQPGTAVREAWAETVRKAGLLPAWARPADEWPAVDLLTLDGPWLLVLDPPAVAQPGVWAEALLWVAGTRSSRLHVALRDVAPCLAWPLQGDVALVPRPQARPWPEPCHACGLRARCPGPPADGEVRPWPTAISNQFDLVEDPTATLPSACPPPDAVVLQRGRQTQVFRNVAGSFQADQRKALRQGQLYLDVSDKARLDDFAEDLRLLTPLHPPHDQCAGRWTLRDDQPFEAEEALLRSHLRALTGTVVDVGAGPLRYLAELAPALQSGQVRYLAVEPDAEALARLALALPHARCLQGVGEHLPLRDGVADAVLMLRSFNHLRDVPAALAEAVRVLRPGGKLVVVDNVAFGLARTPQQRDRAHAVTVVETPFEHYRNASGAEAAEALRAAGLKVREVHDVGPGRSNQWLVVAEA